MTLEKEICPLGSPKAVNITSLFEKARASSHSTDCWNHLVLCGTPYQFICGKKLRLIIDLLQTIELILWEWEDNFKNSKQLRLLLDPTILML